MTAWNGALGHHRRLALSGFPIFLLGVYSGFGACGTHHCAVACLCRALDQALTVSDYLLRGFDYVFDTRPSFLALRDEVVGL